jgi:enoyl-CoA hydratase
VIERGERDGIAVIRLAHGKANTMDFELCQAVTDSLSELRSSPAKAVVLTGQGRIFSAGVDLIRTSQGGPAYVRRFLPILRAPNKTSV